MRARELGLRIGTYQSGNHGAITDVEGIRVGYTTLAAGDVRSGVTAIVADQMGADRRTLPAAVAIGNGYGKLTGSTQVAELGTIETPVVLTSTLSVFRAADAVLTYVLGLPGYEAVTTLNPVVGETNDGFLSDIRARSVTETHVLDALGSAVAGPVAEGCVGAGTGTTALGYKGGIGTASRIVPIGARPYTVGALVQSNFGGTLTIRGMAMPADVLLADGREPDHTDGHSCMIVVATDAPVDARQLARMARRAVFSMARVGADYAGGSGDYAIAFTTGGPSSLVDSDLDPMFGATMDVVEEALLSSVLAATTTTGYRGRTAYAVPVEVVRERLAVGGNGGPTR